MVEEFGGLLDCGVLVRDFDRLRIGRVAPLEPPLRVPARRIKCFRMDRPGDIGGLKLDRLCQYALRFRSKVPVVVQYGRMDVTQTNLAYIGTMGHAE